MIIITYYYYYYYYYKVVIIVLVSTDMQSILYPSNFLYNVDLFKWLSDLIIEWDDCDDKDN